MIKTSIKYKPLYDILLVEDALKNKESLTKEKIEYYTNLSKVDIVVCTGGRGSAKSFEIGDWNLEATLQNDFKTLYTRFTNVSMSDSVIAEIQEKIDLNSYNHLFRFTNNKYYSLCGDGMISFKGIKPGSGGQTANLKSLKGFNCMVAEEAAEIPDYETFQKVYLSIRSNDKQNLSILILNPETKDHWIAQKLYIERGVPFGFNGIKDNILYIHTSYLDVDPQVLPKNIVREYDRIKNNNPEDYEHIVMGGWITDLKGALYRKSELQRFSLDKFNIDNVEAKIAFIDPADRGTDSTSAPCGYVIGDRIYITDWYFSEANQEVTIPELVYFQKKNELGFMAIETNGVGLGYAEKLYNVIGCQLEHVSQQSNKHSRIISNSGFVRNYFVFRDDYEPGSMYDKAMRELFAYNKDDKENHKNTQFNDDAPDSITGLWLIANDLMPDKWL